MINLSYLIPKETYHFFREILPCLDAAGIDARVNVIDGSTEIVLAAILPATPDWIGPVREAIAQSIPVILWHWDHYSFVDTREPRWQEFFSLLPLAADIWSCSYETARQLRETHQLYSTVVPAWIDLLKLRGTNSDQRHISQAPYAFYAASNHSLGKRVDWARRAATMLGIDLKVTVGQSLDREGYLDLLRGCRVYLMTAFEESNGTIPAMEAAALGKPVVCADIPSNREVFGNCAFFFRNDNFRDLLQALTSAWESATYSGYKQYLASRIISMFDLPKVAPLFIERILYIESILYVYQRDPGRG